MLGLSNALLIVIGCLKACCIGHLSLIRCSCMSPKVTQQCYDCTNCSVVNWENGYNPEILAITALFDVFWETNIKMSLC